MESFMCDLVSFLTARVYLSLNYINTSEIRQIYFKSKLSIRVNKFGETKQLYISIDPKNIKKSWRTQIKE